MHDPDLEYEKYLLAAHHLVVNRLYTKKAMELNILALGKKFSLMLGLKGPGPLEDDDLAFHASYREFFGDEVPKGITRESTLLAVIVALAKEAKEKSVGQGQ